MTFLARYKKALAAFVVGVAAALALLPTDADPRLLALVPVVNALVVALGPANAPPKTGVIVSETRYERPPPPDDPLASPPRSPGRPFGGTRQPGDPRE